MRRNSILEATNESHEFELSSLCVDWKPASHSDKDSHRISSKDLTAKSVVWSYENKVRFSWTESKSEIEPL